LTDLKAGEHICFLYETPNEHQAVLTPFLRDGLERREKVVYIADSHDFEHILDYLRADQVDVESALENGQLSLVTAHDTYLRDGAFDPDKMIAFLREQTDRAISEGYTALRVSGEMTWVLGNLPDSKLLIEYEAKLNEFFPESRCLAICQYDRRKFDAAVLLEVLRTHPKVIIGTETCENCYYVPPATLKDRELPEVKLQRWLQNILAQERASDTLRREKEKSQRYIELAGAIIVVLDPTGNVTFVNKRGYELLGYPPDEVIGKKWCDHFVPERYRANMRAMCERLLTDGAGPVDYFECPILDKDGNERPVAWHSSVFRDETAGVIEHINFGMDLSEWKLVEARICDLLNKHADGVVVTGLDKIVQFANPSAETLLGRKADELVGKPFEYPVVTGEVRAIDVVRPDGQVATAEMFATDTTWKGERVYFISLRDVTRQDQITTQLRELQRLEALGRLAGGIAHDFNNLLTVIRGYAELVLAYLPEGETVRSDIEQIRAAADNAAQLTQQLLAFGRKQSLQPKVLNLNQLVIDAEKMLQRVIGEDVELKTVLAPDLNNVKVDPTQITQVIMNLVINARDAMPEGGRLIVETENVVLDEAYTQTHVGVAPGHYVMLAVSDTGMGMDKETLSHIFEPFFTTKKKGEGTGLGLSTVHGIVKQSGGHIMAYSELGHGTTFKIYLPCVDEAGEPMDETPQSGEVAQGTETILVTEDEKQVRDITCRMLAESGYTVLQAGTAQEAIRLCQQHQDINLLIVDMVLPDMRGPTLVEHIQPLRPNAKVLYTSGYTNNSITHRGVLPKGTHLLQKPFGSHELLAKVREVLDEPEAPH